MSNSQNEAEPKAEMLSDASYEEQEQELDATSDFDDGSSSSGDSFDSFSSTASTASTSSAGSTSPSALTKRFSSLVAELVALRMLDHKHDTYPMKHIACIFSGNACNPLKVVYGYQLVTSGTKWMRVQPACGGGCHHTAAAA